MLDQPHDSHDSESHACCDDTDIPQATREWSQQLSSTVIVTAYSRPEVGSVEDRPSVPEFGELYSQLAGFR